MPLARLLAMSYRWFIDQLHQRLAATGWDGIRPAYGFVLLVVRSGPLTPTALAGRLGVTKQAASKLADAMVSDGLIRRAADGRDGRQRLLSLAPRGHELLAAVESIYVDLEAEWERVLGRAALAGTRQALSAVMLSVNEGRYPDLRPEAVD